MHFDQQVFLFFFLPAVLFCYAAAGRRYGNVLLLLANLVFYAWEENIYLLVLLASLAMNYCFGLMVGRPRGKLVLALALAANLALLGSFKYADFLVENINYLTTLLHLPAIQPPHLHQPLGISFFTFQVMSYLIDIYRRQVSAQRNPLRFSLYLSFFPQLAAGPIVRYRRIFRQIESRRATLAGFAAGARRFIIGFGKKVLIADILGKGVNFCFALPPSQLSAGQAALGAVAFTLQIYYDFSAYSDMAIGLARMFGFRFPENFDRPYRSLSIREFWRRWHMTLSFWFRDYLYIPLGGNRSGALATCRNLLLVFLLCGLWHGANWTFICWGLWHGLFLVLERPAPVRAFMNRLPNLLQNMYVMSVVTFGWVFFRADDLAQAGGYLAALCHFSQENVFNSQTFLIFDQEFWVILALALAAISPLGQSLENFLARRRLARRRTQTAISIVVNSFVFCFLVFVLLYSLASVVGLGYRPFLYSQF